MYVQYSIGLLYVRILILLIIFYYVVFILTLDDGAAFMVY